MEEVHQVIKVINEYEGALMVIITAVYVIATVFICYANIKSANASNEQLKEMRKQYANENRPVITVELIYVKRSFFGFRFRNAGKLIANNVRIKFSEDFCNSLNESFKDMLTELHERECIIGVGQYYDVYFANRDYCVNQNKPVASGVISYTNGGNFYTDSFSIDMDAYVPFYSVDSEMDDLQKKIAEQTSVLKKMTQELSMIRSSITEKGDPNA